MIKTINTADKLGHWSAEEIFSEVVTFRAPARDIGQVRIATINGYPKRKASRIPHKHKGRPF
jgi:hypothetical protein